MKPNNETKKEGPKEESLIEDKETKLKLDEMEASKLSELRFLLGGFGDARHLYASLIDLNQQFEKLDVEKQKNVKI